jgi:hypothetical protein
VGVLLIVDVVEQRLKIGWTDGESAITSLASKGAQGRRLSFEPFGRRFQFFDEFGHGKRPGEADGEMPMIGNAARRGNIRIRRGGRRWRDKREGRDARRGQAREHGL